jgi:hypothetical protein
LNRRLEDGQLIALRIATGVVEKEFPGVVRSFDGTRRLISLEIVDPTDKKGVFLPGKEATIVGRPPDLDLDIPCVVAEAKEFPVLICRGVDRRNHLRINPFLSLSYRTVERELYETDPEGFLFRFQEEMRNDEGSFEALRDELDPEIFNPTLLSLFENMNKKLDRILSLFEGGRDVESRGVIPVNISGSGLRFTIHENMEAGKLLAVRIVLPLSPPAPVVFVAEVRRVREKANGEFEIAAKYLAIDEADRDKIVHYTFKRMRESIRSHKR